MWLKVITFMVSIAFMVSFITFMVGITFMVFIAFMGDQKCNQPKPQAEADNTRP